MAKKPSRRSPKKPQATFEVRLVGPGVLPEKVPLRVVNDALSAIQDLASGRDPFNEQQVPPERSINLLDVCRGSATYRCIARDPRVAVSNLVRFGAILASLQIAPEDTNDVALGLRPLKKLSEAARSVGCRIEVSKHEDKKRGRPLLCVHENDYERVTERLFVRGDTTIVGRVERAGGATEMRCLLRVPGRRRLLYCDVHDQELARRLGHHLYEEIAATGVATWLHHTWDIYSFTINDFTQPRVRDVREAFRELRNAGLDAWDEVEDPDTYIRELR